VAMSTCVHVGMWSFRHVSLSALSTSACGRVSMCPCRNVAISACLHVSIVHVKMCPCQQFMPVCVHVIMCLCHSTFCMIKNLRDQVIRCIFLPRSLNLNQYTFSKCANGLKLFCCLFEEKINVVSACFFKNTYYCNSRYLSESRKLCL